MIDSLLFLTEAHAEAEGGFGLKFDLLESNLINLSILLGVLFFYGRKIVGNVLSERRAKIATQIQEVEKKLQQAAKSLEEQQQKLKAAEVTAAQIRQDADVNAEKTKQQIIAQGEKEVERVKAMAVQDLNSEQDRAVAELRQRVTALAIERVEAQLQGILDDSAQQTLIDRSIAQLGDGR
ncbi:MAG: F0F1 ATP synthase subunit B [Xenococcaceae cyanobacterium]